MTERRACADCGCMYDTSELVECEELDCGRLVCHDCAIECYCCGKMLCWECQSDYYGYCDECTEHTTPPPHAYLRRRVK